MAGTTTTFEYSVDGLSHPGRSDQKGLGTLVFNAANDDLLEVTVTVEWVGVNKESTYSSRSLFTKGY